MPSQIVFLWGKLLLFWHCWPGLQGMIFITDPYFNEPAYEGMRGTAEGATSSLKYNSGGERLQGWPPGGLHWYSFSCIAAARQHACF